MLGFIRVALVALTFVCPLVGGPSVSVWQLLVSWGCLAGLLLTGPVGSPAPRVWLWLGLGGLLVALSGWSGLSAWGPAFIAIAGIAAAASVGSAPARDLGGASRFLAKGVLAAGLVSAVLGLLQYYGLAEPLVPWTTSPALGQAYGNLRQRNQFATLISMAWCAALWLYATNEALRVRRGLMAAAVLLLIAAAASTSRTGLLQLLSITGVAAFIAVRERRNAHKGSVVFHRLPDPKWLLATLPLYFAIAWLLPQLATGGEGTVESMLQRLHTGAPQDHSRLILWRNVLTLIAQHPWTGWGWGELSFAHYSTRYDGPRFVEILDNAHNLPLHLAVELGIPAAVLICGGFLWMVLAARPWRERDPARLMAWGMLGAIVLHSLLEYPLWYGPFQLVFGLCLGILWPGGGRVAVRPALSSLAAGVMLVVVGLAGWDYVRVSQIYLPPSERLPAYREDTLAKVRETWLFARQAEFAQLTLTTVTPVNAAEMHSLAQRVIHFSPEPRVIVKLIESAELLGRESEAQAQAQAERFSDAFPQEFARWLKEADRDPQLAAPQ
ncbi:O-antigen ligase [Variovorax sp. SG517]|uniref:PglL family O-oligosaccharyltransferase n=1 Tax=Variovorax sp. SG517 TaxID=2587117 RepID=UPI00159CFF5A|nr:Wzy polymerase domain-containing protein [Variovorax sp. SG517]NVM89223.1 O-antigen ligase [Variovorax sp. SG517]